MLPMLPAMVAISPAEAPRAVSLPLVEVVVLVVVVVVMVVVVVVVVVVSVDVELEQPIASEVIVKRARKTKPFLMVTSLFEF
jgi:hypothetical protein